MLLKGLAAIVTGGANGNGLAIAQGFAAHGACVCICDIDHEKAQHSAAQIRASGGKAYAYQLDISNAQECRDVVEHIIRETGPVDILVNNAGIRPRHDFDSPERDALWHKAMQVNVDGVRTMSLACLESLAARQGKIINISSIAASRASAQSIAYSTSKAAVEMLTKVMALELSASGIRINAIAPGIIETHMTEPSRKDPVRSQKLLSRIPMARFGKPEDLVGPALFLASDMSSYMTGAVLAVDGGYLCT